MSAQNVDSNQFQQWERSLSLEPAILTTNLTLIPIYEIVDDEDKKVTLRAAMDDLFHVSQIANRQIVNEIREVGKFSDPMTRQGAASQPESKPKKNWKCNIL